MVGLLNTYSLPKLNKEHINNEIKAAIKNPSTKKSQELDKFTAEFYQTFKRRTKDNASQIIL
jgi:hypothetical protein